MSKGDKAQQDERAAEKAAREAAWWAQWRENDYSWDGLAALEEDGTPEKRWIGWSVTPDGHCVETATAPEGSRPATRQDYLRWDSSASRLRTNTDLLNAGLLVKDKGQSAFHILHLPPSHSDGRPSFKADLKAQEWQTLEAEVDRLIRLGGETDAAVGKADFKGADNRTQLSGAILRRFPSPPAPEEESSEPASFHLAANFSAWLGNVDASTLEFGSSLWMRAAAFLGDADFGKAQFSGGYADFGHAQFSGRLADFWNAQFSGGYANFENARFSGGAPFFRNAQFSGGYANFENAQFSCGNAFFLNAQFSGGYANFENAQFSGGYAYFQNAQFSGGNADFRNAQFSGGDADFENAQFSGGDAYFWHAQFSGRNADFRNAQFSGGDANFENAQFSGGDAYFTEAQFSGGDAFYHQAQFSGGDADFQQAEFELGAIFLGARFHGEAGFRGARFRQACEFGQADQHESAGTAILPGAQFDKRLSLRSASFKGLADFSRVRFPQRAEDRNSAFEGARFFEPLDFKGVATLPFSAFHGIRLDQGILLDSDHPDPAQFDAALKAAAAAAARDDAFEPGDERDPDSERRGRDKRFAALEAGCRALKTAMAEENDRAREQVFYTFELRAREHRFDRSAEPGKQGPLTLAGYRFSRAYGIIANYGTSISRPLIWLGKLTLGFAALNLLVLALALLFGSVAAENWVWWAPDAPFHPSLTDTLGLAFKNALGPLRVLAGNGGTFDHLGDRAPIFTGLMLVSTLIQGLASSALIFLSLLALRRQFQIN